MRLDVRRGGVSDASALMASYLPRVVVMATMRWTKPVKSSSSSARRSIAVVFAKNVQSYRQAWVTNHANLDPVAPGAIHKLVSLVS